MNNIKVVLIGDTSVGKSSIAERFVNNTFSEFNEPTIGAAFLAKNLENIKFEIWDTAGQERYRSLAPMYYRGASAAIVVYDIRDKDTFNNAKSWINEIKQKGQENCVIVLAGNKCDLPNRNVDYEYARDYADYNNVFFIETSAKSNINIDNIFKIIINNYDPNAIKQIDNNVRLIAKKKIERKCC